MKIKSVFIKLLLTILISSVVSVSWAYQVKTEQGVTNTSILINPSTGVPYTSLPVDISGGGTGNVSIESSGHSSTVTITRPSDTTAYTAGDVIGDTGGSAILSFANMCRSSSGCELMITSVELEVDSASVPSGMTGFNVRLYNTSPTAIADNAVWDLVSGDRGKYLGNISLGTPIDEGATLFGDNEGINKQIKLTSSTLYVELQTNGAFTPTSAAVKRLTIHGFEL